MGIFLFVFFISAISYTTCHPITDPIDILAKIPIEHHTNNTQLSWGNENTTLNIGESQTLVNRGDGSLQTTLNKPDAEPFKSMQIEPKPISAYAEEMSNTKKLWMESRRKNGSKNDAGNSV